MSKFAPGHRVIVLPDNGYDWDDGVPSEFGTMAGHFGRVVELGKFNDTLVSIDIIGNVNGELCRGIQIGGRENWLFYESELEHVD